MEGNLYLNLSRSGKSQWFLLSKWLYRSLGKIMLVSAVVVVFCGCTKEILLPQQPPVETPLKAKNIILMIGDGMGLAQVTAHMYQQRGSILLQIQNIGLMQTHSSDNIVTDSGASATAMASGQKTFNNAVGLNKDKLPVRSIMEICRDEGMGTGIVTTSSILDATPAAFYAHRENRYYYDSISIDLLTSRIDFLMGGGKNYFDDTMEDRPVLLKDFEKSGYDIFDFQSMPINRLNTSKSARVLYFNGRTRPYMEILGDNFLNTASVKAMEFLERKSDKGYFLLIEAAQIDWAGHAGNTEALLDRMLSFEKAIREVMVYAQNNKETLVVVTGDHSTGGMTIVEGSEFGNVRLNFSTNGHTACMVPVFSYGPGSDRFRGVYNNSDLFEKMLRAIALPGTAAVPAN